MDRQRPFDTPTSTGGSASLSDLLTTAKNIVTAINDASQTFLAIHGTATKCDISSAVLLKTGAGRVARVSVTTAGSTVGAIYDANSASATTNLLYVIPDTVGIDVVDLPISYGIVIAPGTGQVVSVSYS